LLCAACEQPVTDRDEAISVDGRHDHRCVNPGGWIYDIGCFARAPGVVAEGATESYFSWFKGYAWQIACCTRCEAHLGWAFTREGSCFYGLILERLREAADEGADPS
jgi:hypothetical protein